MHTLLGLPRLTIEGLMTIPPLAPEAEASRQYFVALRDLRDRFASEFQIALPHLSMGMTGDFVVAIEEGATMVRVGTAIFGKRTPMRQRCWALRSLARIRSLLCPPPCCPKPRVWHRRLLSS